MISVWNISISATSIGLYAYNCIYWSADHNDQLIARLRNAIDYTTSLMNADYNSTRLTKERARYQQLLRVFINSHKYRAFNLMNVGCDLEGKTAVL